MVDFEIKISAKEAFKFGMAFTLGKIVVAGAILAIGKIADGHSKKETKSEADENVG